MGFLGLFCIVLGGLGALWKRFEVASGHLRAIGGALKLLWLFIGCFEPFWSHIGPYRAIYKPFLVHLGAVCGCFGLFCGRIRANLNCSGVIFWLFEAVMRPL
jgi:hypothetical protein